jgi:CRP-like cAMP-binding protein
VSAQPRSATVRATSDADLLEIDAEALAAAASSVPTIAAALDRFTRERLLGNLMATSPFFRPLDRKQRLDLVRRFSAHDLTPGTAIIEEGSSGRGLYLLLHGQADVSKRDGDEKVLLATLGPTDVFGEISLLGEEPTTASVTAATQCTVLFLSRELFQKLAEAVPEIRDYVEELSDERRMDTRLTLSAPQVYELDLDDLVLI